MEKERILYNNGRWDGIWNLPKYQSIRDKINESFNGLTFIEEGHKYFLNGKEITCVSNVTHRFKEPFNVHEKSIQTSEKYFNDKTSKYYKMTPEEIEEQWKQNCSNACNLGSERHEFGESCFYFMTKQYDKILPSFKNRLTEDGGFKAILPKEIAIVKFWEDLPQCYVPILCETKTYREDLNYSGTFDILFYYDAYLHNGKDESKDGLLIFDYKTNTDLYKNYNEQKLLYPFEDVLDMNKNIYTLQLSLYQLCLQKINFKVIKRMLIWLRPNGEYDKIPLDDFSKKLENFLIENPI